MYITLIFLELVVSSQAPSGFNSNESYVEYCKLDLTTNYLDVNGVVMQTDIVGYTTNLCRCDELLEFSGLPLQLRMYLSLASCSNNDMDLSASVCGYGNLLDDDEYVLDSESGISLFCENTYESMLANEFIVIDESITSIPTMIPTQSPTVRPSVNPSAEPSPTSTGSRTVLPASVTAAAGAASAGASASASSSAAAGGPESSPITNEENAASTDEAAAANEKDVEAGGEQQDEVDAGGEQEDTADAGGEEQEELEVEAEMEEAEDIEADGEEEEIDREEEEDEEEEDEENIERKSVFGRKSGRTSGSRLY